MAHVIAVAGKGGVGKTTLTGLIIQYLGEKGKGPILAVDADANSNLNEVLGVKVDATLGDVREEVARSEMAKDNPIPAGMTKADYMEFKFDDALVEDDDFDLLVMGRTQGKGCYCFVNGLLQAQLQRLEKNYPYIIVDNEAGMEHISRKLTKHVDTLILVSDCAKRSIQAVARIRDLAKEMNLSVGKIGLIVNKAPNGELSNGVKEEIEKYGLDLFGVVPSDELIYEYDSEGIPLVKLPADSKSRVALEKIIETLDLP